MAQPSLEKNAAARAKLVGPFHNPGAYASAEQRAFELRQVIADLTNPAYIPEHLQPSTHPFNQSVATRTETRAGRRAPSMYYNIEPERKVAQALSSARHEQEIVRAAMAMFSPAQPMQVTPAISGPYHSPAAPRSVVGPLGMLIDLLTHTTDLNSNEDAELAKRRGLAYSNAEEYNNLLQQVLNSGAAKPP